MSENNRRSLDEIGISIGETAQPLLKRAGSIGKFLIAAVTGSSSPNYIQADWSSPRELRRVSLASTITIEGDEYLRPFTPRRYWERAVVLATTSESLDGAAPREAELRPAVAYLTGDKVHVGLFPEDRSFGWIGDTGHVGAAFRLGRGSLTATLGHWQQETNQLHVPEVLSALPHNVPIKQLADRYPGLPLI